MPEFRAAATSLTPSAEEASADQEAMGAVPGTQSAPELVEARRQFPGGE